MKDAAPDFLSDEPSSAPVTEAPAAPETAKPEAPAKEPAAPAQDPAASPAEAEPAAHHVPLATFLDIRDRAAAAEKRAEQAETWRKEQEAKARQQPLPDRNQDPEAYEDFRAQQLESRLQNITLNNSERFATLAHGKESVEAAKAWALQRFQADPAYQQQVLSSSDPYEFVVSEWKRDQTISRLGDGDLDAFLAWKATQAGDPSAQPTNPAPAIRASPAAPRPSLASAPAAGRTSAPEGKNGEATFDSMFG